MDEIYFKFKFMIDEEINNKNFKNFIFIIFQIYNIPE